MLSLADAISVILVVVSVHLVCLDNKLQHIQTTSSSTTQAPTPQRNKCYNVNKEKLSHCFRTEYVQGREGDVRDER